LRRANALLAHAAPSFAKSASSDITGPESTKQDCGGVYNRTGTSACE
jgi:hypothetical protein